MCRYKTAFHSFSFILFFIAAQYKDASTKKINYWNWIKLQPELPGIILCLPHYGIHSKIVLLSGNYFIGNGRTWAL